MPDAKDITVNKTCKTHDLMELTFQGECNRQNISPQKDFRCLIPECIISGGKGKIADVIKGTDLVT